MSELNILTEGQVIDYLRARDLREGTEEFRTFNALLNLEKGTFVRIVSAIAQGLVSLASIRSLPAVNDRIVEALIISRLSANDSAALEYKYKADWLPASIDYPAFEAAVIGDMTGYLGASLYDASQMLISPEYDFNGQDETKFFGYSEAFDAYMKAANSGQALSIIQAFNAKHDVFAAEFPALAPTATGSVHSTVNDLTRQATFLKRPSLVMRTYRQSLVAFLVSGIYAYTPPSHLRRFMEEIAYPAMAALAPQDPAHSGFVAVPGVKAANVWLPLVEQLDERAWRISKAKIARVHLPEAYGQSAAVDRLTMVKYMSYLEEARRALIDFQAVVANGTVKDPNAPREVSGSPVGGLLLTLTHN